MYRNKKSEDISEIQLKKKTRFPISRIKRIILQDDEIGKTTTTVHVILSRACELFLQDIVKEISKENSKVTLDLVYELIEREQKYSFLKELVSKKNNE